MDRSGLFSQPKMQRVKTEGGDTANNSAEVPQQVWIKVIENVSCGPWTKGCRERPGETKDCHVAAAHLLGCKAGNQRLAGRHVDHLADRDDNERCHEQGISRNESK